MPDPSSRGPRRLAALLMGAQAAVLAGFSAFYLYELAIGEGSGVSRVVMSAALILVGAMALALVARAWVRDAEWPRSPTIVWSLLLVPVGIGLVRGGVTLVGWAVVAVGVVTALAAVASRAADDGVPEEDAG